LANLSCHFDGKAYIHYLKNYRYKQQMYNIASFNNITVVL
jgi:hypothetical protein